MKTSDAVEKCEMCNGVGIVGGHAQDGSFDAMDCPECTAKYEHPRNDEVAMTVGQALDIAESAIKPLECTRVLAAEVRRLRDHSEDKLEMITKELQELSYKNALLEQEAAHYKEQCNGGQFQKLTDMEIIDAWPLTNANRPHAFDLLWFARFIEREIEKRNHIPDGTKMVEPNDLECLKINYDVAGWEAIAAREGQHCVVPLGAVYAIRSLIAEVEALRTLNNNLMREINGKTFMGEPVI